MSADEIYPWLRVTVGFTYCSLVPLFNSSSSDPYLPLSRKPAAPSTSVDVHAKSLCNRQLIPPFISWKSWFSGFWLSSLLNFSSNKRICSLTINLNMWFRIISSLWLFLYSEIWTFTKLLASVGSFLSSWVLQYLSHGMTVTNQCFKEV